MFSVNITVFLACKNYKQLLKYSLKLIFIVSAYSAVKKRVFKGYSYQKFKLKGREFGGSQAVVVVKPLNQKYLRILSAGLGLSAFYSASNLIYRILVGCRVVTASVAICFSAKVFVSERKKYVVETESLVIRSVVLDAHFDFCTRGT